MDANVRNSVDIKLNFFEEYMDVPAQLMPEFLQFKESVETLGEQCADSLQFEQRFAAEGYQDTMNALIPKCVPKAVQMTAEQKQASRQMAKELNEGGAKEVVESITGMAATELKSEALRMRREQMIEAGTFDDYTRLTNKIDDAKLVGKFLSGKFRKK